MNGVTNYKELQEHKEDLKERLQIQKRVLISDGKIFLHNFGIAGYVARQLRLYLRMPQGKELKIYTAIETFNIIYKRVAHTRETPSAIRLARAILPHYLTRKK